MSLQPVPAPPVWAEAIDEFLSFLAAGGRRPATVAARERWVKRFAREVGVGPWQVGKRQVLEWSGAHPHWSQDTRRGAHAALRAFYTWAEASEYLDAEDVPLIPYVRQSDPMPRPAPPDAIARALQSDDPRVVLAVRLAAEVGLRRGEAAIAHSRDLITDLTGHSIIVHGKGGRTRVVPLPDTLAAVLLGMPYGYFFPGQIDGHVSAQHLGILVNRALPRGVTMHKLRHAFATAGFVATRNLVAVQHALGHKSPETTLRYIAVPGEDVRSVVEAAAVLSPRALMPVA